MRDPEVSFASVPPLGERLQIDGLTFELVAVKPRFRQTDGQPSPLLIWRGACASCGAPFEAKTPLRSATISKRCGLHKAPGKPATPAAKARWAARGKGRATSATGGEAARSGSSPTGPAPYFLSRAIEDAT